MIEKLRALFKNRTKLMVIIFSAVVICLAIAIPTGLNIHKKEQIIKEQALKIKEFNMAQAKAKVDKIKEDKRISDEKIADKQIADKAIADKIITDKKIADENARLAKIETTRVANKKISDEKIRVAKLNAQLNYVGAESIAQNLRTNEISFTLLCADPQWVCGHYFYIFQVNDSNGYDVGADWRLGIDKTTRKAYRYYADNTLYVYNKSSYTNEMSGVKTNKVDTGMTLEQALAIGYNLRGESIDYHTVLTPVYNDTVVINGGEFYVFSIYNEYAPQEGVNWRLCISKASGKAFKQLPNKTLHDFK
ncbi:hypothetical protein [Clostridium lacusfryxellense]|uniref:hypothetical protein n=1 Tax=Clostridium lacusfryxellense TaxID=205328 RepID=UPI001C0B409D|nr:hypothetical protein [Clostridium lacusfryxellense]MBU3114007.1 hypothetical protein [Clostridium lacusfryxellense]